MSLQRPNRTIFYVDPAYALPTCILCQMFCHRCHRGGEDPRSASPLCVALSRCICLLFHKPCRSASSPSFLASQLWWSSHRTRQQHYRSIPATRPGMQPPEGTNPTTSTTPPSEEETALSSHSILKDFILIVCKYFC